MIPWLELRDLGAVGSPKLVKKHLHNYSYFFQGRGRLNAPPKRLVACASFDGWKRRGGPGGISPQVMTT